MVEGRSEEAANESDEEDVVDEHVLTRTLHQLARRERTLASLRVQLHQAEHMRIAEEATEGKGTHATRRKWLRVAASLRAAISLLAPVHDELQPRPCSNPSVELCVCDGWLLRSRSSGGMWRRQWVVLKSEGLLVFDGVAERVPSLHLAIDGNAEVETVAEETPRGFKPNHADVDPWLVTAASHRLHRRPPHAFTLRAGGRTHTFACDATPASPSGKAKSASADEWVRSIRMVVEMRADQDVVTRL